MRLIRPDLAEEAFGGLSQATEWPYNVKFVYIRPLDILAMGHFRYWHAVLFQSLVDEALARGTSRPNINDDDVLFGHLEWEEDRSYSGRTEAGNRLPPNLQSFIDGLIADKFGTNP